MADRTVPVVLVVDDDEDIRDALRETLERHAFHVLLAHDGRDALVALRAFAIDLIVLDLSMPGMSGWQLLDARSREPRLAEIPVVVATAVRDLGTLPTDSRVTAILRKPFTASACAAVVRAHCPAQPSQSRTTK